MSKVLSVLDMLDRHNFEKVETNNCLESLYNKIFTTTQHKDGAEVSNNQNDNVTLFNMVKILCFNDLYQ